jgi:catechol-2,3-dioxygenase
MSTNTTLAPADRRPRIARTHLALFVRDPFASAPWYESVLGMQETARGEQWVFLSFGRKHHDIALIRAAEGEPARGPVNMQHYGLEIEGDGLYFTDPDGHRFEFFCETVHGDEEGKQVLHDHNAPSVPMTLDPL